MSAAGYVVPEASSLHGSLSATLLLVMHFEPCIVIDHVHMRIQMVISVHSELCIVSDPVRMQMVIKCADIGHLAVDPKTHKRWAYQLEEEFFRQVSMCPKTCLLATHLCTEFPEFWQMC